MSTTSKVWTGVGVLVTLIFILIFASTPLMSSLITDALNVHPFSWTVLLLTVGAWIGVVYSHSNSGYGDDFNGWWYSLPVTLTVFWIVWLIIQGPLMMVELYHHTKYTLDAPLTVQEEIRSIPYTVASTNFESQNPDSRTKPGDSDYVKDHWIASIDPKDLNVFGLPTQGFFIYDPNSPNKVVQIRQEMTFAEAGWLFNSATYFVRTKEYFAEFYEVLYIPDPSNDGLMAVTTLIKRDGFNRHPYAANVLVAHSNGDWEIMNMTEANTDPRFDGVALRPEWLVRKEVEAYGWREGWLSGLIGRKGRVQVQSSSVNDDNSAPFHMKSVGGYEWFTPFSPLGSTALTGMAVTSSKDVNAPIRIWSLPANTSYAGADYVAALIESSEAHRNLTWYRVSGDSKCGNITVLEVIPVVRKEKDGNHLYNLGYVSSAPKSVSVLFFTIVDPYTQVVYEDIMTAEEVNSWLRGEYELKPQTNNSQTPAATSPVQCTIGDDLSKESDQSLLDMIRRIVDELSKR